MKYFITYIITFALFTIAACSDGGESKKMDTQLMNYARYCHVDTLDSILEERHMELMDYPEIKKLRRLRIAEEISHVGTQYYDVHGILSVNGVLNKTSFKEIIEKSQKPVALYFCNSNDVKAARQLKFLANTHSVTDRYNIICVPMGTLKQRNEYVASFHYPDVSVFIEKRIHSLLKGLYGINLSPSVVVINTDGTITARCKNIPTIYKTIYQEP